MLIEVLAVCATGLFACTEIEANPQAMQPMKAPRVVQPTKAPQAVKPAQEEQAAACLEELRTGRGDKFIKSLEYLAKRAPVNWLKAQDLDWFALTQECWRTQSIMKTFGSGNVERTRTDHLAGILAERLIEANDRRILKDYIPWVEQTVKGLHDQGPLSDGFWFAFAPLINQASRSEVDKACTQILSEGGILDVHLMKIAASPMIALKPFRKRVLALLGDNRPVDLMQDPMMELDWAQWPGCLDMRICDRMAIKLAYMKGMPLFDPTAPMEMRDEQIAEIRTHLDRYGHTAFFAHKHIHAQIDVDYYVLHPAKRPFKKYFHDQGRLRDSVLINSTKKRSGYRVSTTHLDFMRVKVSGKSGPRLGKPLMIRLFFSATSPEPQQIPDKVWQPGHSSPAALAEGFHAELTMQSHETGSRARPVPLRKGLTRIKASPREIPEKGRYSLVTPYFCELDLASIWQIDKPAYYKLTVFRLPFIGTLKGRWGKEPSFGFDLLPALGGKAVQEKSRKEARSTEFLEVKQPGTSLYWLRCPLGKRWKGKACSGERMSSYWTKAMRVCPDGYRLPTQQEFMALLGGCHKQRRAGDYFDCNTCAKSKTCRSMFGKDMGRYWSSSPWDDSSIWDAHFRLGIVFVHKKLDDFSIRCVRTGS